MARPPIREICVPIEDDRRDALLSALRRRHAADALEQLDSWLWTWEQHHRRTAAVKLGQDVRDLCRRHVNEGDFEAAHALLDRYLFLPPVFTKADAADRQKRLDHT